MAIKNTVMAILKGELLLRMQLDKYFIHIAYTFLLVWLIILYSMMVQNTLATVERNRSAVNDLKIFHAEDRETGWPWQVADRGETAPGARVGDYPAGEACGQDRRIEIPPLRSE